MATNSRAPVTEDIWHLSIDDLLAPLPEKPRLGGPGPFVINLSSSTASIGLPSLNLAGCETAQAYEIQRSEDGRTRYRLRLGPFETEEAAEILLDMVREIYPSALTATAAPEDLKAIATIRAKAATAVEVRRPPMAAATQPVAVSPPVVAKPPAVATPVVVTTMAKSVEPPVITERVERTNAKVVAQLPMPTPVVPPVVTQRATPVVAAHPRPKIDAAQKFNAATAKPSMSVSAPLVRRPASPTSAPAKTALAPAKAPAEASPAPRIVQADANLSFDSTQTMRVLTSRELEDQNARPWFVIELATAGEAFDPDTVPNLDIFVEYRLYSVAELGSSNVVHALRVGFFSAEIAAKAVASYLAEYYEKPTIKRVSLAERERFAEQAVEARKDVGATGRHSVIEITDDLIARRKRFSAEAPAP